MSETMFLPHCHCGRAMQPYLTDEKQPYFLCDEHGEASVCQRCGRPFDEEDDLTVGNFQIGLVHTTCPPDAITQNRLTSVTTERDQALVKLGQMHELEARLEAVTLERDRLDQERQDWGPTYNATLKRCLVVEAQLRALQAEWKKYDEVDNQISTFEDWQRARRDLEDILFPEDP